MAPTILIVGATGNTGRAVVSTLSSLLTTSAFLKGYRLLVQTRSASSPAAQQLAALPGVEVAEIPWIEITAAWLQSHSVVRAFVASPVSETQFEAESTFLNRLLRAGVEYVVRVGTTASNTRPDCEAYYARNHWALETMLGSPEFASLKWTSLQPNVFTGLWLHTAAAFVKEFRATGKQPDVLRLAAAEDAPVAPIDPDEVGVFAARLLATQDVAVHSGKKYVINGPVDISGKEIVKLVEGKIGAPVGSVAFKDTAFVDYMVAQSQFPEITKTVKHSLEAGWERKWSTSITSKEVLDVAPPKVTPDQFFEKMLLA